MNLENHATGSILDRGIGVRGGVVEQPYSVSVGFLRTFCLLCRDGAEGSKHGGVDRNLIVQESSKICCTRLIVLEGKRGEELSSGAYCTCDP